MKTYLYLQCKRVLRFFPFVAAITVAMCIGLGIILNNAVLLDSNSTDKQRFKIGVVGNSEDSYLELGMKAVETFDSSRFAVEFTRTDEASAQRALEQGELSAYIVMPDGFVASALRGNLKPIKYVTTPASSGLSTIFKDELTSVISAVLSESQKGVYGLGNALRENGHGKTASAHMDSFFIKYIDFILSRSGLYHVEELGVSDNLSLPQYLLCGISVLFLFLAGLPYAPVFVRHDFSLNKKLVTQGYSFQKQIICEYASYLFTNLLLALLILVTAGAASSIIGGALSQFAPSFSGGFFILLKIFPVVLMLSALTFLIFEISGNLVNGVLLYFFSALALCYISGCLYPIYTFPQAIQNVSPFLPTGIARSYLAGCITGKASFSILWLILYSGIFLLVATLLRRHKTVGRCNG